MNKVLAIAVLMLVGLLLIPTTSWASSVSASPGSISDTVYQDDINQVNLNLPWFPLDTGTATTAVSVSISQTGSWSVDGTVSVAGVPTGADVPENTALQMSPDGGANWYTSGSTIRSGYCSPPICSDNFTVWYRLNLEELGDGASSTHGNYSLNVTYRLSAPDGSSTDSVSVTITANAVASIMIYSQPSVDNPSVDQSELSSRYFGDSGGFGQFAVQLYAISDYEVTAHASITGCGGSCQPDGLLHADVYSIITDDEGCIVDQSGWQSLSIFTESPAVFTGCNTQGGNPYSTVRLALRMDLGNVGDSSTTWSLDFQITVTITEQ